MIDSIFAAINGGNIGKDICGLDAVFFGKLLAVFLRSRLVVREAIEADINTFGGEAAGDDGTETGGATSNESGEILKFADHGDFSGDRCSKCRVLGIKLIEEKSGVCRRMCVMSNGGRNEEWMGAESCIYSTT